MMRERGIKKQAKFACYLSFHGVGWGSTAPPPSQIQQMLTCVYTGGNLVRCLSDALTQV